MTKFLLTFGIALTTLGLGNSAVAAKQLQVKGSDTEVNLVQQLAEKFMAKNKAVSIGVTGGGSGTGIAALFNKTADLANSSRALKDDELQQAKTAGMEPQRIIFATDALSVIVNESNPLKELTLEQTGKIFKGEIKNWKELGGADSPISLYGRQSNSGTFTFFRDQVLKGDYSPEMKSMNGNSQIVEGVAQDKAGVGYVGIAYGLDSKTKKTVKGIKLLPLAKDASSKPVDPKDERAVTTGKYPVSRPLFQYFVAKDAQLIEFLKYELSPEGRKLVLKEGFYEITKDWRAENEKTLRNVQH